MFVGNCDSRVQVQPKQLNDLMESEESLHHLFHCLDIGSLTSLGQTSKKWNQTIYANDITALYHLIHNKTTKEDNKLETANWLIYLEALKLIDSNPEESARLFSSLCRNVPTSSLIPHHIRTYIAKKICKNPSQYVPFFRLFRTSNETDNKSILKAQILISLEHLHKKGSILKDGEISELLRKVIIHKNGSSTTSLFAKYVKGCFTCEGRDPNSTYRIAFDSFQEILKIRGRFTLDVFLNAQFYSNWLQLEGMVPEADYNAIAKDLNDLAILSPLGLEAKCKFYVAKLAMDNLARVTSAYTVVQYLKDALTNPNLPETLRKEAYRLVHQKNAAAEDDSEYSFEGSPSNDTIDFSRTALVKSKLGSSEIEVGGKKYPLITHKTTQFYGSELAFCQNNAILVLDPVSECLDMRFGKILRGLERRERGDAKCILSCVVGYIHDRIFKDRSTQNILNFIALKKQDLNIPKFNLLSPVINIDEFVKKGLGVNIHEALGTAYILDRLTYEISPTSGKPYLTGKVQIMHETVLGRAHMWVTLVNDHEKLLIDTTQLRIINFTTEEGAKAVQKSYGFDATVNQLLKTDLG